jgi:hypothetical protein
MEGRKSYLTIVSFKEERAFIYSVERFGVLRQKSTSLRRLLRSAVLQISRVLSSMYNCFPTKEPMKFLMMMQVADVGRLLHNQLSVEASIDSASTK